jgi:hypothetical protein
MDGCISIGPPARRSRCRTTSYTLRGRDRAAVRRAGRRGKTRPFKPERQIEHASLASSAAIKRRIKDVERLRCALDWRACFECGSRHQHIGGGRDPVRPASPPPRSPGNRRRLLREYRPHHKQLRHYNRRQLPESSAPCRSKLFRPYGAFYVSFFAVAFQHQTGDAPDIDFRDHTSASYRAQVYLRSMRRCSRPPP